MNLGAISRSEVGYICGLFEGDGYNHHDENTGHYTVEFYLNSEKDEDIIAFITDLLESLGLNPSHYKDKRYRCCRVRVRSKDLFQFLDSYEQELEFGEEFKIGFISGVIDAEGYVNHQKSTIEVVNTDRDLLSRLSIFLKNGGIKHSVNERVKSEKDKLTSYRVLISVELRKKDTLSRKLQRGTW